MVDLTDLDIYDAPMLKSALMALALLVFTTQLAAQDYTARNVAMGGAGVASSDYLNAGFINPALTTRYSTANDDDWGLLLPTIGVIVADPDSVLDGLDNFETSFNAIESTLNGGGTPSQAQLNQLASDLLALDGKSLQLQAFAGAALAIPSRDFGMSLIIRGDIDAAAFMAISAADAAAIRNAGTTGSLPTLTSEAVMLGAGISEVGLAIGREFEIGGHAISLGVTPKLQRIEVFNYAISVDQAANIDSDFNSSAYRNDDTMLNVDLGAHMQLNEELSVGLAVRDLLEQDLVTPVTNGRSYTYTLSPVVTAGAAWQWGFLTLASDLDLTKRDGFSNTSGTQFLRFGAETAWTWGQLRAGFRKDLENTVDDMLTAGIGISPFGVLHLDLAGAVGQDSYGAVVALSFTF